jgi:hypothetical protein
VLACFSNAAVRPLPFTIRLKHRVAGEVQPRVSLDPGSKTTGIAVNPKCCKLLHRADGYSYAPRFLASRASAPAGASARRFR